MNVVVTGGSGLLGRHVAQCLATSHKVLCADVALPGEEIPNVMFCKADIMDRGSLTGLLKTADAVVHLAAIPGLVADNSTILQTNVMGTFSVLEACAQQGVKRFVFAGSICAYGFIGWHMPWVPAYFPIDEKHPTKPDDAYGLSKLMGDQMLLAYAMRYGMTAISLRFAPVFFPNSAKTRAFFESAHAVGSLAHHAYNLPVTGAKVTNAGKLWSYVDARDAATAVGLALDATLEPGRCHCFNIGAADVCSEIPSLELIKTYYPSVPLMRDVSGFLHNSFSPLFGIRRAQDQLGYSPRFSWRDHARDGGLSFSERS